MIVSQNLIIPILDNVIKKPSSKHKTGESNNGSHVFNTMAMTDSARVEVERLLKNSLFASTMLLNLINDLLDLAKLENSKVNLTNTIFNLHDVINRAINTLDFQAS